MKKESLLIVRCYPEKGACSVWNEHFTYLGVEHNVSWMLSMVDAAIERALKEAPPDISIVQVSFVLAHPTPRPILASAFREAAIQLNQIVGIVPEDRAALARNPFVCQHTEPIDDRTGEEVSGPESTGKRRTGKAVRHDKA